MASRRLTKELRTAFVRAAMQDVPTPDEEVCNKEFEKMIYTAMPDAVKAVFDLDPEWLESMSIKVEADWNVRQEGAVSGLKELYRYAGSLYLRYKWKEWERSGLPAAAKEYVIKLENILTDRLKLMIKLWGISEGCKTVAQLKEALPEFEKYMPDDTPAPTKALPVIANLMADVIAAGWPGGKIVNAEVVPA